MQTIAVRWLAFALVCASFPGAGYGQTAPVEKTVSGRVEIAGSKIYYEECGSGPSAVVQ